MAVSGISARDFFDLARFSWTLYDNIKSSREKFSSFQVDVECLLISVGSLDKGHTRQLVAEYIDGHDEIDIDARAPDRALLSARQIEIQTLRDGLLDVLTPFTVAFTKFQDSFREPSRSKKPRGLGTFPRRPGTALQPSIKGDFDKLANPPTTGPAKSDATEDKVWKALPVWVKRVLTSFGLQEMSDLRSRFTMQAANFNLFMSRLTHLELHKQTTLLTLRWTEQTVLDGAWEYGHRLKGGSDEFRRNVGYYVQYLLDGGEAFTPEQFKAGGRRSGGYERRSQQIKQEKESKMRREEVKYRLELRETEKISKPTQRYESRSRSRSRSRAPRRVYEEDNGEINLLGYLGIMAPNSLKSAQERLNKAEEDGLFDDDNEDDESTSINDRGIFVSGRTKLPDNNLLPLHGARLSGSGYGRQDRSPVTSELSVQDSDQVLSSSPSRRIESSVECDNCHKSIFVNDEYYACSTGRCAEYASYDLCRRCHGKNFRCPGRRRDLCPPMRLKTATVAYKKS